MTKKIKKLALATAVAVVYAGFCITGNFGRSMSDKKTDLLLRNVEVLSGTESKDGETFSSKELCIAMGGNWNEASHCTASGFEDSTCTISGEISLFGVTLKGSYSKGKKYKIAWDRYSCSESAGNCCTKQGLYSSSKKLA